ncbi:alginate lyase [Kribbella sp. VKM Ac-2527]|uniref:Alginate lyase n=1 Tax=Kribbella caucasensis TaxID=2512215 RepID=A0A4R6KM69_9ACTN|nr:alginate lyase family protein [Kribbella sp. VKM Ac-2527]TDO52667.1 alginate lyase [Kribbella sp. VKM Ac-2527]
MIRLLRPLLLSVSILLIAASTTVPVQAAEPPERPNAAPFNHPGVLVSKGQLDHMRSQVLAGAQPQTAAYEAMKASASASLDYTPKPRAIVECGSNSIPNNGCTDERNDAIAAYTHALLWYVTKDDRYAKKAIQIMDAWSAVLTDHTNSNAPLQTGWSGASFSRTGELIKYTYSGPWAQRNRFEKMLRDVYLPEIRNGAGCKNGNWELIMMDAAIGIAVFLDDRAAFDKAIGIWRGRVPGYVYQKSDGPLPKAPTTCSLDTREEIVDYWQGQSTFSDGLSQETCRDFGHTGWGLTAAAHVAETAWHQGVNLYGEVRKRLTDGFYFHTRIENGAPVPADLCGGTVKKGLGAVTEVVYNHYHNRLGMPMPTTLRYTEGKRPAGSNYFYAWETLTHADNP